MSNVIRVTREVYRANKGETFTVTAEHGGEEPLVFLEVGHSWQMRVKLSLAKEDADELSKQLGNAVASLNGEG